MHYIRKENNEILNEYASQMKSYKDKYKMEFDKLYKEIEKIQKLNLEEEGIRDKCVNGVKKCDIKI
ncbi:MAG: hypothetical protein ATN31_04105 [Candidatus Epulonipiscioides saccharophilum]|nr:MAG: hypothetical protein ATN31_04105 [Epulopiscium sp. AS2M-Bin001]